ncbi:unnamed protein product [Hermetia illucens]|uniref:Uncharacterized protein n=1 Tax=Hermetia illucens TaxID=343691 RepID=A0A7R8YU88_HERIL|nr:unnamed protein product [Hermetia illucens]
MADAVNTHAISFPPPGVRVNVVSCHSFLAKLSHQKQKQWLPLEWTNVQILILICAISCQICRAGCKANDLQNSERLYSLVFDTFRAEIQRGRAVRIVESTERLEIQGAKCPRDIFAIKGDCKRYIGQGVRAKCN